MAAANFSRQREAIKAYLCSTVEHPTAETVYQAVKQEYPRISLATVYRNLNQLAEQGDILKLAPGDGMDHFDATTAPHSHFLCRICGRVSDISLAPTPQQICAATRDSGCVIEQAQLFFTGICRKCENNNENRNISVDN